MSAALAACLRALVRGYQLGISPWLPRRCRFYPSCSTYALAALGGPSLSGALARIAWRLARCQPFGAGGVDLPPGGRQAPLRGRPPGGRSTTAAPGAAG